MCSMWDFIGGEALELRKTGYWERGFVAEFNMWAPQEMKKSKKFY